MLLWTSEDNELNMVAWNEFEVNCGFGEGDETKRFGPRQETGSSLYQVDTVASILNTSGKVRMVQNGFSI